MEQQIGYCTSADGTRIAYATYGDGPGTPLKGFDDPVRLYEVPWQGEA